MDNMLIIVYKEECFLFLYIILFNFICTIFNSVRNFDLNYHVFYTFGFDFQKGVLAIIFRLCPPINNFK